MNKKKIIILCCFLVVIVVVLYAYTSGKPKTKLYLETTKVSINNLTNTVTATGTIEPVIKVEVGTQVSGILTKLYVDYNSIVKKGQIIAELDKTTLLSEYESQKANLAIAQSEYDVQLKNYTRNKTLHEKGLISDSDYEQVLYSYENAKNSLSICKNNLTKAKTNLSYATIYSPIDGVVLSKAVEEGQTVAASFSTPTLFYIANDLTQMRVIADVDEADIGEIEEGQRVEFSVDAYIGTIFDGKVTQVRQNATTTNNVVTYQVVISAYNPDLKLKPGLTANVTIYTLERNNVLCVASEAFKFNPNPLVIEKDYSIIQPNKETKDCTLWVVKDKTLKPITVTKGISSRSLVEIIAGIDKDTEVVISAKRGNSNNKEEMPQGGASPFMPGPPGSKKK